MSKEITFDEQETGITSAYFLNLTKGDISELAKQVKQSIADGNYDGSKALIWAAKMSEVGKQVREAVQPFVEAGNEVTKGQPLVKFGTTISDRETGVKWDFSGCNDPELNSLYAEKKVLDGKIKDRENFLKGTTKKFDIVTSDFEVIAIHPPVRTSSNGLVVTIDK